MTKRVLPRAAVTLFLCLHLMALGYGAVPAARRGPDDFEAVTLSNFQDAYALRQKGTHKYIVFPNKLKIENVRWVKHYRRRLFWKRLSGSNLLIVLRADYEGPAVKAACEEIKSKDPSAEFQRPWMTNVGLIVLIPWLDNQQPTTRPDKGFPLGTVPVGWALSSRATRTLESFTGNELVIGGTVGFTENESRNDFNLSFSINASDLAGGISPSK